MPLKIYRRHLTSCSARRPRNDSQWTKCSCPVWVDGLLGGKRVRESLDTISWQRAAKTILEAEARGTWESLEEEAPSPGIAIQEAKMIFLNDAERGRKLSPKTIEKYSLLLRRLGEFAAKKGFRYLKEFDSAELRQFREGWEVGPRTALKQLELLKAFFRFAHEAGWVDSNVAKPLRCPKLKETPKQPFTEDEIKRIYEACQKLNLAMGVHSDNEGITNEELLTFVMLLRYSGLRISDAVMLTTDRLQQHKLFLYTQKTGQHVYVPLPPILCERLKAVRLRHGKYYFVGPRSMDIDVVAEEWRRKLGRVFVKANVAHGHPHRFRHTFAVELLLKGVSLENVSVLLGHSSLKITEKHYAAWVRSRQDALEEEVSKTWAKEFKVIKGGKRSG